MQFDLQALLIGLGIAFACVLLVALHLGVVLVACATYASLGLTGSLVITTFYLAFAPVPVPVSWPWRKPA